MAFVNLFYIKKTVSTHSNMNLTAYLKRIFQLLYVLVSLNIIFFLVVYHRLILINPSLTRIFVPKIVVNQTDNNSVCFIPRFDPWDQTIAKSLRIKPTYRCPRNRRNLINVINSTRLQINQHVNKTFYSNSITHCVYLKIDRNPEEKYFRDWTYSLSEPILIRQGVSEPILDADFVLTRCYKERTGFFQGENFW